MAERYRYDGLKDSGAGDQVYHLALDEDRIVEHGGTIELSEEEVDSLRKAGHKLTKSSETTRVDEEGTAAQEANSGPGSAPRPVTAPGTGTSGKNK